MLTSFNNESDIHGKYNAKTEMDVEMEVQGTEGEKENGGKRISEFRTVLPQIIASTAKNLILLDLGMTIAFPTIVIPELLKAAEGLKFTESQASWFGSITFICQPAGSVISGLLFEPLGRKRAMLLVNLPHILGWFLFYSATSLVQLYVAGVIMGVGVGFMEAPILTYVGEISQPKWRGILTAYAGLFVTIGFCFVDFVGTTTDWQTTAAICASVPMLALVVISQVPESPIWLLSKGRKKEAERNLCWLRGWVKPEVVQKEFSDLVRYNDMMYKSKANNKPVIIKTISGSLENSEVTTINNKTSHVNKNPVKKLIEFLKLKDLFRRQTMLPLLLVISFFFFHHSAGVTGTRPFLVEIFREFGSPLDAYWVTVISTAIGLVGNIIGMIIVPKSGKRLLTHISFAGCAVSNVLICIYGFFFDNSNTTWIPIGLFIVLNFMWNFGIGQIPWMMTSEVFPFRGRGIASGVAAAFSYVFGFLFTKTYYNLHESLTLPGVFGFYGFTVIIGWIYLYYFLPETEGKTLEEIETVLESKFKRSKDNNNS